MKKSAYLLLGLFLVCLYSCSDDYENYYVNEPVYMSATEFRSVIQITEPEPIRQQGKICFYEGYLFISDPYKGIHVIDNRDPKLPKNIAYIELLGNVDLSVRNNILYADAYVDLVWFDVSNPAKPQLKGRTENVFPYAYPVCDNEYGYDYESLYDGNKDKGVVVGWKVKKNRVKVDKNIIYDDRMPSAPGSGTTGKVGSMSRFAIYHDYLYAVISNELYILDLKNDAPVAFPDLVYMGLNIETIFSYKDCMYFGTPSGMIIYSVANPLKPEYQSRLDHVYGCDPVVVENDMAYVTIWSGNLCGQNANELFIVDVSDVKNPKQIASYNMTSPKGLGIDNGTLFVCDDGLKIFDAADPQKIMSNMLAHHKGMSGFDVIPSGNVLMMIASDGLYQYDYSDLENIKQLSKLSITK